MPNWLRSNQINRRRRRTLPLGNLTGEADHESQTVLQIMELCLGDEPCPIEIGILPDDPRQRFAKPWFEIVHSQRGEEELGGVAPTAPLEMRKAWIPEGG